MGEVIIEFNDKKDKEKEISRDHEDKKRNDKNNRTLSKTWDDSDKLENKFANLKSDLPRKQTELDNIRQKLYANSEERSLISKEKDSNLQKLRKVMADEDALKSDERTSKDLL